MTHNEQVKLIREAYDALSRLNLQDGFFDVADRLLDMNTVAERRHRNGRSGCTLSVRDAAKYFVCSHLLYGWNDTSKWAVDDILNIRTEVLYAQAYASRHYATLADWAKKYSEPFKQVDYAKLMQREAA